MLEFRKGKRVLQLFCAELFLTVATEPIIEALAALECKEVAYREQTEIYRDSDKRYYGIGKKINALKG